MLRPCVKPRMRMLLLAPAALIAGAINSLLGTGGGMVLTLALRTAYPDEEKVAMALSTACVLFFSVLSTILYAIGGHIHLSDIAPAVLPALLGGVLGSLFLGRIRHASLDLLLALLLLWSGARILL